MGEKPLSIRFPRLFHLSENKEALVSELGNWENGRWVWDLRWRRDLFEREKEAVNSLLSCISGCVFHAGEVDGWIWKKTKEGKYTTKSAYLVIQATRKENSTPNVSLKTAAKVWDIQAVQKARVTVWRAFRNRLPTCENLRKRSIGIDEMEMFCNACFEPVESTDHSLICCPKALAIWDGLLKWIGVQMAHPQGLHEHFSIFCQMAKDKKSRKFLKSLWVCTIWILWRKKNERRFEGTGWDDFGTIMEIISSMWSWNKIFNFCVWENNFSSWCSLGPMASLCI
ncbi:uncharacterized protein LOC131026140 [Salvia miltiorrhiza]|uniref:uncharacterized protein LOC131026140 n=1 Tax=Salvia miltiorrhiza TaxID=226208 RepID=UPI0025ACF07E|nr:uncharacterized protein LOC131026140 [Salvia miltiorrhiza]